MNSRFNPELDLILERELDAPVERVWRCWTEPEHLKHWFVPKPWSVSHVEIDPRPGGIFHTVMRSPEGQDQNGEPGCFLIVEPHRRLVWTDGLGPEFRPRDTAFMTADLGFAPSASGGTLYRAWVLHADAEARRRHEDMGFHDGWGTVAEQLATYARTMGDG